MLVYIAFVAALTLWIIHFEERDHDPEVVITDSLKTMNIGMLEDVSDVSIEQNNFISILSKYNNKEDPYGILSSEKSKYSASVERRISNANIDEALKHKNEHTYYEIYFPIAKTLFFKVANLTLKSDVKFTADEIYSVLKHLFMYLDDKFYVSYMIYKNMLENPSLCDQLERRCDEQMDDGTITSVSFMFSSLMIELANYTVFVIVDDYGNIATASIDNHEDDRFRIYKKLNELEDSFPIQYLTADADFISQNNEFLHSFYVKNSRTLTVTIDFTAIKYIHYTNDTVKNKLEELSSSTFLQLECIQVIDIHFSEIIIDFDCNFLKNKLANLVCNDCTLSNGIKLPEMNDKLLLEDCNLNTSLFIPENIGTVIFRNVEITEDVIVTASTNARHIEFISISGYVNIPNINENLHIEEYNMYWSFKQVKDANGTIEELLIECAVFKKTNIDFCHKIKKLVLRNINLDEETTIIIRNSVETVHIEGLSGTVHLHDSIVHSGLLIIKLNNGDLSIQNDGSTQTTGIKHNAEKHKKLLLKNADIMNDISISDDLFEIYFVNVAFSNNQKSLKLKNNICAIYLDDCNGSVSFNNIAGLDQILFEKNSNQLFIFNKSSQTGKATLRMESITLHGDVTLSQDVDNISLFGIRWTSNGTLTICQGYDSLNMVDCQGKYRIPGISQNGETIIDIQRIHSMHIKLKKANMYDVHIKNLYTNQPWTVDFDIDINDLELDNITCINEQGGLKFTGTCRNVSLTHIFGMISFVNVESFNKMVLKSIYQLKYIEKVLKIPAKYIEINKVLMNTDIMLHNQVEHARITCASDSSIHTSSNLRKILLNNNIKSISSSHNDVLVDMSAIICRVGSNNIVYAVAPSQFELVTIDSANFTHLMLKGFRLSEDCKLKRKVKSLELKRISSINESTVFTIKISHELNNIGVTDCDINISLSHPCKLRKMSINRSKMAYNPTIYTSVEYISLVSTEINELLVFTDSVRVVYLEDVNIKGKIVLSPNITSLSIINVIGLVDMSRTVIDCAFELKGKEVVQLEETASRYSLSINNVCFSNNHQFSPNIQTIKLKNINISDCTVKVSDCHHVEISSCTPLVISRSDDKIRGLVQGNRTNGLLVLSNIHTLKLHNAKFSHSFEMPSYIRTISFETVKVSDNIHFVANQECEEIHLLSCKGVFDIRKIAKLRKVTFISSMNLCTLLKNDDQSNDLYDLEIGGNVNDDFVISVLSQCNNLKRLTLHNPMLSYRHGDGEIHIIHKKKYKSFSIDNNLDLLSKIFSFNMINKLEYLDMSELFVDYAEIETLKNLKRLHTLVVNNSAIDQIPLKNIPKNIETYRCVNKYTINTGNYYPGIHPVELSEDENNLRHLDIKNITLTGSPNIIYRLPAQLEKLIIKTLDLSKWPDKMTNISKSYVKELVLHIKLMCDVKIMKQKNFARRYYVDTLEYFQKFIDFDRLEKLVIEIDTTRIYLNTRIYQVL